MGPRTTPLAGLLAELGTLLDEERQALLRGPPDRIAALSQQKLALADHIDAAAAAPGAELPDAATLARLQRGNRDNAVICSVMLRHMSGALDKLRRHELHRSYQADGSERNPPAPHTLGAA